MSWWDSTALIITLGGIVGAIGFIVVWQVRSKIGRWREPMALEHAALDLDLGYDAYGSPALAGEHNWYDITLDLHDDSQEYSVALKESPACHLSTQPPAGARDPYKIELELGREALHTRLRTRDASRGLAARLLANEESLFVESELLGTWLPRLQVLEVTPERVRCVLPLGATQSPVRNDGLVYLDGLRSFLDALVAFAEKLDKVAAAERPSVSDLPEPESAGMGWLGVVCGLMALAVGGGLMARGIQEATWPRAMGQVREALVIGGRTYDVRVVYEYEVGGRVYEGSEVLVSDRPSREAAEAMAAGWPAGERVAVSYEPEDPAESVLESASQTMITGGLIAALAGALMLLLGITRGVIPATRARRAYLRRQDLLRDLLRN